MDTQGREVPVCLHLNSLGYVTNSQVDGGASRENLPEEGSTGSDGAGGVELKREEEPFRFMAF